MKKKIMTMLMLLAVSCMIMPTNAKAAKKAYIKTSTGSKATVFVGKTLKLNAKTVGKKKKITYKTSKKSVATVNSKGVIKGKKYGTAKITMKASGVKTKKITVYVRKAATGICTDDQFLQDRKHCPDQRNSFTWRKTDGIKNSDL